MKFDKIQGIQEFLEVFVVPNMLDSLFHVLSTPPGMY